MANKHRAIYVSIPTKEDEYIDVLRLNKARDEKKHYTKTEIVKHLISLGICVEQGEYIKLNPSIDKLVSTMQNIVIEINGEKINIKKSKQDIYTMLIEKGLQHLND